MIHPLSGVRVIECGVAIAGPLAARYLASLGAEVIKVDNRASGASSGAPRWLPKDIGLAGLDYGPGNLNVEKLSVGLDLKAPAGREAFSRLVAASDVFVTNFSVPGIESLGIRYEDLREWNPAIIYIALTGFGDQPGPYRDYRSWGPNLSALSGIDFLTGDSDRAPVMTPSPFPDHVSAYHAVCAIINALLDRRATGQGQEIAMAQLETTVGVLGPQLLEAQLTGIVPTRMGNRNAFACPRGLFPSRGVDRWVAIEVSSDDEWQALAAQDGFPADLRGARFATHADRLANEDELEALLGGWTSRFTNRELAMRLQAAGVAANPVDSGLDQVVDPHLEARGYWKLIGHDRLGSDVSTRLPMLFGATPGQYTKSAPSFGHDTDAVLEALAGLAPAAIDELARDGIAEREAPLPAHIEPRSIERPSRKWAWPLLRVFDHVDDGGEGDVPGLADDAAPTTLAGCRVLDLSDHLSAFGSRLLVQLGADVTRIEPPGGSSLRRHPPFANGESLFQRYIDAGKRTVTLDLDSEAGQAEFRELVATADIVYESNPPGYLDARGIGWERIQELNPRAILVSVTPFGQTGPYRDWKAGEIGIWARSGSLPTTGYPDRRPVAPGGGLGLNFVGTTGAIASLAALHARALTGLGQWVDVSAHEVLVFTAGGSLGQLDDMVERKRNGVRALGSAPYGYFTCRDRLVCLLALMPPHWDSLARWIAEKTGNQAALDERFRGNSQNRYLYVDEIEELINSLAGLCSADEFCAEAQARGVPAMPVNSVADLLADAHLSAVGFWREGALGGQAVRWPGPAFRLHAEAARPVGAR